MLTRIPWRFTFGRLRNKCATGYHTIISTNCTMFLNSANMGVVYYADEHSTIISANCTMTSNSGGWSGVYYTKDYSTVTATDCTMTSNIVLRDGAVYFAKGACPENALGAPTPRNKSVGGDATLVHYGELWPGKRGKMLDPSGCFYFTFP